MISGYQLYCTEFHKKDRRKLDYGALYRWRCKFFQCKDCKYYVYSDKCL